ncbi:MAG: RNA polymerase sigma factor [Candidatus Izemoplasmatales bacterium]
MAEYIERLVRRLKDGDRAVFDEIYERTRKTVYYSVLPILRDRSLADDIVQDCYMKMLDSIGNYTEKNFLAYLVTIARNLALNEYRRRRRTVYTDADIDDLAPFSYESPLEIRAGNEAIIRKALSALDEDEKAVFLLHNVSDLPHREIALVLGKPIGTVTWLYSRAVRKVRAAVKED